MFWNIDSVFFLGRMRELKGACCWKSYKYQTFRKIYTRTFMFQCQRCSLIVSTSWKFSRKTTVSKEWFFFCVKNCRIKHFQTLYIFRVAYDELKLRHVSRTLPSHYFTSAKHEHSSYIDRIGDVPPRLIEVKRFVFSYFQLLFVLGLNQIWILGGAAWQFNKLFCV